MNIEKFGNIFSDIKKELCYDDNDYLYNYDLVKHENEDYEDSYNGYDSDSIDTKDHLLEDFEEIEYEIASNSSEAPPQNTSKGRFFFCKKCNLEFETVKETFKHRANYHARRKPFLCMICNVKFTASKKYNCHVQKHCISKYMYCSVCKIMFEKKRDHSAHMLSHMKTSIFCNKCNKHFRIKSEYRQHLNKFRKTYFCHICNNNFFYLKCYQQHMIMHLRYDKLLKVRSLWQYRKRCLVIQREQKRSIKINFVSTPVKYRFHRSIYKKSLSGKLYKCYQCLSTFSSKNNLKNYIKCSTRRHLFKCPLCKLGYCANKTLPSPAGNHTKNKFISCEICNLKFYDQAQKEKHTHDLRLLKLTHDRKLIHEPEAPKILLPCDICDWKFPDLIGLKTHVYFSHF